MPLCKECAQPTELPFQPPNLFVKCSYLSIFVLIRLRLNLTPNINSFPLLAVEPLHSFLSLHLNWEHSYPTSLPLQNSGYIYLGILYYLILHCYLSRNSNYERTRLYYSCKRNSSISLREVTLSSNYILEATYLCLIRKLIKITYSLQNIEIFPLR